MFPLQTSGEASSCTMLRRWRRRATYWTSWRSSVCPGPGGPGRGPVPPGSSPRCWTCRWTDTTQSPETCDRLPPAPCSPTGCWPTDGTPALLSGKTSAPSAPSTSTRSRCTRRRTRPRRGGGRPSGTAAPEARRVKAKTPCSRCRAPLAGLAPRCRRCSSRVRVRGSAESRPTGIRRRPETDSTAPSLNRSTSSKASSSPRPNSPWVSVYVWFKVIIVLQIWTVCHHKKRWIHPNFI